MTHKISHIISLIIFPFIGKPILQILFDMKPNDIEGFIDERIEFLPDVVIRMTLK